MRIFGIEIGWAKKDPPKKTRGPARSAAEREKAEQLRYIQYLKRNDFAAYKRLMESKLGTSTQGDDPLDQFEKQLKRFKEMGLIRSPKDLDDGDDFFKDLAKLLPALLQGLQPPPQQPPTASLPASIQPGQRQPLTPEPQAEDDMDPVAIYLNAQLGGTSPADAARWLDEQTNPQAQQLVAELIKRPETQAYSFLISLAESHPQLAGLTRWLQKQGEHWVCNVARALKERHNHIGSTGAKMGL